MKTGTTTRRAALVLLAAAIAGASVGCNRVDTYEAAVLKSRITGKVSDEIRRQGLYHSIFRDWENYNLREVQYPSEGTSERLTALTSDQLTIGVDAAFRYRIDPDSVLSLYLTIGAPEDVHTFVYNAYRSSARDAVAEIAANDILSRERAGIGERIQQIMAERVHPRGIVVTDFFVRDVEPPPAIKQAIEEKLAREQQVQAERFQTQVVVERANQRREEAAGIRDAQNVIAESLVGERGRAFLTWDYLQALREIGQGESNVIVAPTEGGVPIFFGAPGPRQ